MTRSLLTCLAPTLALLAAAAPLAAGEVAVDLRNPSFDEGADANGLPRGWARYAGDGRNQRLSVVPAGAGTQGRALLIEDGDPTAEIGVSQTFALTGGQVYRASARVRLAAADATSDGAYLQLRFLPSNTLVQVGLDAQAADAYNEIRVTGTAPPDTHAGQLYLYTHRDPTPRVTVDDVRLVAGAQPDPSLPPGPVPPVYTRLKDLHLATALVADGRPTATIVVPGSGLYAAEAEAVQLAVADMTGVRLPIVPDTDPTAALPPQQNLVVLGNRSTNGLVRRLYDGYYTLLDLKYPGAGGCEVRTLHNPFGNGANLVFVGGSDPAGVHAAATALVERLRQGEHGPGRLALGWTLDVTLGTGLTVPARLTEAETWEASAGYGSVGYFGWNSISKRMALYYMTGDPRHAREVVRLAFPDAQALKEIDEIDGERIEGKNDPLAEPYHYNAHMAILFWDLIEESPVFTDDERLRITNAFSRQLAKRAPEGVYGLTAPPPYVGSRHGQYAALSLYCLGRYFQAGYPAPVWEQAVRGAKLHFAPLERYAWIQGENDNLFWYDTAIAPTLSYLVLSGERGPVRNGVLGQLLRAQEALLSGRPGDPNLHHAALDFLNKAAYLTGDGRWLHYRERTGLDTSIFRLGQSFWPDPDQQPTPPADLVGNWTVSRLPSPAWRARSSGLPEAQSFHFGSFRSAPEADGDFVLLDGFNGASRNPYHTFAILNLRLAGVPCLDGYLNQVLTSADGMVEPAVAMDAALLDSGRLGEVAYAVGEVPRAAWCAWRRSLAQRLGRYAVVADEMTARTDSDNLSVVTLWEGPGTYWDPATESARIRPPAAALPPAWRSWPALDADCRASPPDPEALRRLRDLGIVLLRATETGAWLEMTFSLPEPVRGTAFAELLNYTDRGDLALTLDGGRPIAALHVAAAATRVRVPLGPLALTAGPHVLRATVTGKRDGAATAYIGLAGVVLQPEGAPPAGSQPSLVHRIYPADRLTGSTAGGAVRLEWQGQARTGQRTVLLSLIGASPADTPQAVGCFRLGPDAAALALPEPGLAVCGTHEGTTGGLVVLTSANLFGRQVTRVGLGGDTLLRTDAPVTLAWEFATGDLHAIVPAGGTTLDVVAAAPDAVRVNGQAVATRPAADGTVTVPLPEGGSTVGLRPLPAPLVARLTATLAAGLEQARAERARAPAAVTGGPALPTTLAACPEAGAVALGGKITELITIPDSPQGPLLAAAVGPTIRLLTPDAKPVRDLQADAPIRVLHWWPQPRLLLAGCEDEKLVAFGLDGQRRWVFVSEMDPAVYAAAKTYWFKSAPGHGGIHGLGSGPFIDGRPQCFVGSACTLEIVEPDGKLAKRLPVFWGPGWRFAQLPAAGGSTDLLIARQPTDSHALAIVNSRTLAVRAGFDGVPAGHSYVGGWACMSRGHIVCTDLDGDGRTEVTSEINGTWNRVTVWGADGTPLHNAQFGPGQPIPARNLRDLAVADLDGDGRQEIVVGTASGLVVALSGRCETRWARRLPSPPSVLACLPAAGPHAASVLVACEDGRVVRLDGGGEPRGLATVSGRPTVMVRVATAAGEHVAIGTESGDLRVLRSPQAAP